MFKNSARLVFAVVGIVIMLVIIIPILTQILPDIMTIIKSGDYTQIETYLKSFGIIGIIAALVIQMLQVFSIIIPSPAIWVPVGAVYGTFIGLVICCTGMVLGNGIVFTIARKLNLNNDDNKSKKKTGFPFNIKNQDLMILLMFGIPGFPNGIVPYISAHTEISTIKFLTLVGIASIPSILCSTCIGELLLNGQYIIALIMTIIITVIVIILIKNTKKIEEILKNIESKKMK